MNILSLLTAIVPAISVTAASWSASPFVPHAVPLAVRSPYLSAWLPQGEGTALNEAWPQFWTGTTLGWAGYVRVDGVSHTLLGTPGGVTGATNAVQKSMSFTSTQSVFVLTAGAVDVTVSFLSPVEPEDLVKQSLPFSYMAISATSNDGAPHSVQVYTDISGEWITGDTALIANWSTSTATDETIIHAIQLQDQLEFQETSDRIQYGTAYLASTSSNATYQTGQDSVVRQQFITNGALANTEDTNFRAVQDNWPVLAIAHDLGSIIAAQDPVVFIVGHARDPAIQYIVAGGELQQRSSYFWSKYSTADDAIADLLGDYSSAVSSANMFDAKVLSDASAISEDYAGIVALSMRQVFGATELTVAKNDDGSFDTADVLMFMKEISSDGNMNTVDVIFPSWPAFLYTNPALGKYLLLPLFKYQATGQYPNKYSAHDLGAHYPNATGHNDGQDEPMPLEESGNMLIMTLSYVQKTGDTSLIETYFDLLDQWTQFLVDEALIPANQISTDDFAGSLVNQTNLAIKGIVGIRAMAEIADKLDNSTASSNYSSIASSYVEQFMDLALSSDGSHLTLSYGNDSSWGLSYNLYGDKLLGLNIFPDSLYQTQAAWYKTVDTPYGVPLDTRHTYTKSDWQIFTAALLQSTSTDVRDMFVSGVTKYSSDALAKNTEPTSDWYETSSGGVAGGFRARPVVGGHLALLAL
ncbi:unnamed protein product [Peniophora sp. CBMAI 1063]|nr:unnamed protein product [Peniophora sp. CBMAI 1063]